MPHHLRQIQAGVSEFSLKSNEGSPIQVKQKLDCDIESNAKTPSRFSRSTITGSRVLPDVVNPSSMIRRRELFSFRTPVMVKSRKDIDWKETPLSFTDVIDDKVSPSLALLRMTPGVLKEKQQHLISQHEEIRQKGDHLKTGGGISLWPDMQQMRLTRYEVFILVVQALTLCLVTLFLLHKLHGQTFLKLHKFTLKVQQFCDSYKLSNEIDDQTDFNGEVIKWHTEFLNLTDSIQGHFDMSSMSPSYQLYILTYIIGLAILLYYLLDNMLSRNKLTPSRIKKWACLLAVIGTWTSMMAYGLHLAYRLEKHACGCVQGYSASMAYLVISPLDLGTYQAVLLFWRSRFLDNASYGLLTVLGLLSVKDLVYFLQYYSVPIATVIISPVLKLCWTCFTVYGQGEYYKVTYQPR